LQQLRGRQTTLLDDFIEFVRQIDLHSRHTPKYTPIELCGKLRPPNDLTLSCERSRERSDRHVRQLQCRVGRRIEAAHAQFSKDNPGTLEKCRVLFVTSVHLSATA
jgi:hypothetical protein